MIHEIVIRLNTGERGTVLYICQFIDPVTNKKISLVENGGVGRYREGDLLPNEVVKAMNFELNPRQPERYIYKFKFNDEKQDSAEYQAYKKFWLRAPGVKPPEGEKNPNFNRLLPNGDINPIFIPVPTLVIEDLSTKEENEAELIFKKDKVLQKFKMLDAVGELKNKRNVAYYFGVPEADTMDEKKLVVRLVEPSSGILMQRENMDKFLDYDTGDFLTQLAINARRAIETKIVESRIVGNGITYFINNHPVADTEEGVITYLDNNRDFYIQYIVEKLGEKALAEKKEKRAQVAEKIESIDLVGLQNKAKERFEQLKALGIKGAKVAKWAQIQSAEKLQDAIKEADETLKVQTKRNQPIMTEA